MKRLYFHSVSKMDAAIDILNLNGLNLMGMDRSPHKRRGGYTHKDQMQFYLPIAEECDPEECEAFRKWYHFRIDTVKVLCELLGDEIGPSCP